MGCNDTIVHYCRVVFSSQEKCTERDSLMSAKSLLPGEVVDRGWFNR